MLDADHQETWDTAVLYQFVHAGALMLTGLLARGQAATALQVAGVAFGAGIPLFSGSLYLLALDGPGLLGPLTPIGGVCFVVGWLALAWSQRAARSS